MRYSDYVKIWEMMVNKEAEACALVPNKNFVITTGRLFKEIMAEAGRDFDSLRDDAYYIRYREVVLAEVTTQEEFIDTVIEIFVEDIESLENALFEAREKLRGKEEKVEPVAEPAPVPEVPEEPKKPAKKAPAKSKATSSTTTKAPKAKKTSTEKPAEPKATKPKTTRKKKEA